MPGFFNTPQYLCKAKYLNKNLFGYPTHKLEKNTNLIQWSPLG